MLRAMGVGWRGVGDSKLCVVCGGGLFRLLLRCGIFGYIRFCGCGSIALLGLHRGLSWLGFGFGVVLVRGFVLLWLLLVLVRLFVLDPVRMLVEVYTLYLVWLHNV